MISKEWLGYYKKKVENSHQTYRPNGFDQIEKDLEVLEILKKHCDFSLWDDTLNIFAKEEYSIDYDSSVYTSVRIPNEEDRKAIKEWLNE